MALFPAGRRVGGFRGAVSGYAARGRARSGSGEAPTTTPEQHQAQEEQPEAEAQPGKAERPEEGQGYPPSTAIGHHPRDLARIVAAAAVVAVSFLVAGTERVDPLESAIYRDLQQVPTWLMPLSHLLVLCGSVAAIAGAAGIAFLLKKGRLGAKLVLAGTIGWLAGHLLRVFVTPRTVTVGGPRPGVLHAVFPADHMAVAVGLATVASPYLPRPARRLLVPAIILVACALVFTGHHLPLDVLAGAFIGWAAGSAVHLAFGAPGRSTSTRVVEQALAGSGLHPARITPLGSGLWGPTYFAALTATGDRLFVEVVRRGQRRAGWVYKLRRLLASLEVEDEPGLSSPAHEVDHEAFVTLLAERAGVRTPALLLARELGHGPAVLVRRMVSGRRLHELPPDEIDAELLGEIWRQVALLGASRIAHHDLRADKILVDSERDPWILDFTFARPGADPGRLAQDAAEMLISLTSVVGPKLAVDSAMRVIPEQELRGAVTYLQPLALPARIRQQLTDKSLLLDVSSELAARLGEEQPSFRPKIRASTVLSLAVLGGAVYLLLPQIGTFPRLVSSIRNAHWAWLIAAFAAGVATFPAAAASYAGAVRQSIPLARTTLVQVASAFTSRLTPGGVGGMGLNLIYLEGLGSARPEAIGSIALNQAAGVVVHATAFFLAVGVLGASGVIGRATKIPLPTHWPVLVGVGVGLVAAGVFLASPLGRRRVVRPGAQVIRDLFGVLRHPVRAAQLFGGSAGVTMANALALVATLAAFDHQPFSVLSVLAVYVGGAAIASPAPTPGNLGAVEAALVAGLIGIGVRSEPAVAAVLTFRLLTFWLPIGPGLVAFRYLQHRRYV